MTEFPSVIVSEIGSRLRALSPTVAAVLDQPQVTIPGAELERLCVACWMMGFGDSGDREIQDIVEIALS